MAGNDIFPCVVKAIATAPGNIRLAQNDEVGLVRQGATIVKKPASLDQTFKCPCSEQLLYLAEINFWQLHPTGDAQIITCGLCGRKIMLFCPAKSA